MRHSIQWALAGNRQAPRRLAAPAVLLRLCLLLGLLPPAPLLAGPDMEAQRALFVQAEQALGQGRAEEAAGLTGRLADYPLLPRLLYQKLSRELDDEAAVADFFSRYGQTRQAELLRPRWLERLAGRRRWAEVAAGYRDSGNVNAQCLYLQALAETGRKAEAFAGAEKLWPSGGLLPASCERLFVLWQADPSFTPEQVWRRYALALQKGELALAKSLQNLLPPDLRPQAELWRRVHDDPRLVLACGAVDPAAPVAGRVFAHGVDRLASDAPAQAQAAWLLGKDRYAIDAEEAARLDRRTALALAARRAPRAAAYLLDIPAASADAQVRGWRVRAALARQDWQAALLAIEGLAPAEKASAQWRYWRGRGLEALGGAGREDYRAAAAERDFYGFAAADRLQAAYALASRPAGVAPGELDRLAARQPFQAAFELLALGREGEARSEWMHAIKPLGPRELLAAAKLAQRWGQHNLAIVTAAKAGEWDDLELRFPLGYAGEVEQAAAARQLAPALVYALVRRESAFDAGAASPAGALGLMQLLPSTGELMARRLGEAFPSARALLDPGRNLRLGSAYLRELLDRFGGRFPLAAAAYNAGSGRVERWLAGGAAVPGDVWVEAIPFSETRQYVAAALFHAVLYQGRLGGPAQRVGEWLGPLPPQGAAQTPDPPVSVPYCE